MASPRHLRGSCQLGLVALVAAWVAAPSLCWGIILGQTDNFNDGTVMGWLGASPANLANGGSSGAVGDHALRIHSDPAPKLLTYNLDSRWLGNWTAAGIERIEFDVRNPNAFELSMRLGVAGTPTAGTNGSGDTYNSATPVVIPANSGWLQASFDVIASGWQNFNGTNIVSALTNVTHFRILHNPASSFLGAEVVGTIDLDNIRATAGGVAGDYNGNRVVDAADYTIWRDSQGSSGANLPADGDGDTMVNNDDYDFWKARFGNTSDGGSATSIPEPAALLLGVMLLLMAGMWRWFDLSAGRRR